MKITSMCPKIKLSINTDEINERIEKYKLLDKIGYELRNIRNDAMRGCITKYEMKQRNIDVPHIRENGKVHTYNTFNTLYCRELEFSTRTLASWARVSVEKKFGTEIKDYLRAKKSIPTFKDQNIIIKKVGTSIEFIDGEYIYKPAILTGIGFTFRFIGIEKDKSIRSIIDRIISGEYNMCDHFIKRDGKFWYLFMPYSFHKEKQKELDDNIIVGVDVGYAIPAVCSVNNGYDRAFLGDGKTINKFKTQIKNRKKALQREGGKSGHGILRVMKSYNNIKNHEANFIQSYNHKISKQVIDFALKHNAGIIYMEDLHNGVKKDNKILLRNWSYYQLQQMIQYKAKSAGIKVVKINPHYTSQTCSKCGYTDKLNRKSQSEFVCLKCGYKENADYNAAKNIANGGLNCTPKSNEAVLTA